MKLHETVRSRRKALDWTQEELASRLGVSASAVHKWETGASCPDIALLSPLARLLGTDLNTLLSFQEDLTPLEISDFLVRLRETMERDGFAAGFAQAMQQVRAYPNSGLLASTVATFLDGALTLFPPADPAAYPPKIETLYRQAAESDCPSAREQATVMLIFRCADRGDWPQAEALLERLPKAPAFSMDQDTVHISLLLRKKDYDEAAECIETSLLRHMAQINILLPQLLTAMLKTGREEDAAALSQLSQRLGEDLRLPPVVTLSLPLALAIHRQDADGALALLGEILADLRRGGAFGDAFTDSPLFRLRQEKQKAEAHSAADRNESDLLRAMRSGLQQDEELAFLRTHPGFAALLEQYGGEE